MKSLDSSRTWWSVIGMENRCLHKKTRHTSCMLVIFICEDTTGCTILSLRAFLVGLHYWRHNFWKNPILGFLIQLSNGYVCEVFYLCRVWAGGVNYTSNTRTFDHMLTIRTPHYYLRRDHVTIFSDHVTIWTVPCEQRSHYHRGYWVLMFVIDCLIDLALRVKSLHKLGCS